MDRLTVNVLTQSRKAAKLKKEIVFEFDIIISLCALASLREKESLSCFSKRTMRISALLAILAKPPVSQKGQLRLADGLSGQNARQHQI
jgi:hypothetical protein